MATHSVKLHTISQLLAVIGDEQQKSDFHVFSRNEASQKIPIKYPFRADYFTIMLVTAGEACLKLNLIDYTVKTNDLLVISPNDLRQFQQITDDCRFIGVGFTRDFLGQTGIHKKDIDAFDFFSSLANPLLMLQQNDTEVLMQFFVILKTKYNSKEEHYFTREIIQYTFNALIYEIAALFRKINTVHLKITRKEDLAMRFIKLLPLYFRKERGLQYYADLLYVTPKYLTQTVKQITGKTAGKFIDEMVVMEAKVLLNDFSKSIGQVAEDLHFSDQFFFSKFFKKNTGSNPSDYRSSL